MADGGIQTATAFWSYAHSDDEGSEGQIRRLKEKLDHAYKRHRGEALASFFDRTGDHKIEWGEEWRSKISTTISGTTFFIPVVSPSYVKSPMCRQEFDEFSEKAKTSNLDELVMPILWVPVDPETEEEERIYDAAKARQWMDWTSVRNMDEQSPEYKALIDQMGARLAAAAKSVAAKPEVTTESDVVAEDDTDPDDGGTAVGDSSGDDLPPPVDGSGGAPVEVPDSDQAALMDVVIDAETQVRSFAENLTVGFAAVQEMFEVAKNDPLHPSATTGQKNFYFKRIAAEMMPYATKFENSVRSAVNDASDLNDTMFDFIEIMRDPVLRKAAVASSADLGRVKEIPAVLAAKFGNYEAARTQLSAIGRVSRDLRAPMLAIDRGFEGMDEIMRLVRDWTAAMETLNAELEDEKVAAVNPLTGK